MPREGMASRARCREMFHGEREFIPVFPSFAWFFHRRGGFGARFLLAVGDIPPVGKRGDGVAGFLRRRYAMFMWRFWRENTETALLEYLACCLCIDSAAVGAVQMLEGVDGDMVLLHGGDAFGGGLGGGERGDGGNAREHGGAADGLLVEDGVLAARRVDDELDALLFDEIDGVGAALGHFEDALDDESRALKHLGRAFGGDDLEAEVDIAAGERDNILLVRIVDG